MWGLGGGTTLTKKETLAYQMGPDSDTKPLMVLSYTQLSRLHDANHSAKAISQTTPYRTNHQNGRPKTSPNMHYTTTLLALLSSLAAVNATTFIHFGCCNRKADWAYKPYATGRCCKGRGEDSTNINGDPTCLIKADTRPLVDFGFCCIDEGKQLGIKDWRECDVGRIERP